MAMDGRTREDGQEGLATAMGGMNQKRIYRKRGDFWRAAARHSNSRWLDLSQQVNRYFPWTDQFRGIVRPFLMTRYTNTPRDASESFGAGWGRAEIDGDALGLQCSISMKTLNSIRT
jgi:hypothetical protein